MAGAFLGTLGLLTQIGKGTLIMKSRTRMLMATGAFVLAAAWPGLVSGAKAPSSTSARSKPASQRTVAKPVRSTIAANTARTPIDAIADTHEVRSYERLVDAYFADQFRRHPSRATSVGVHLHDHRLEDFSKAAIDSEGVALRRFLSGFRSIRASRLSSVDAVDRDLLVNQIQAQLLDLEQVRPWEKNPDVYSSGATEAIYSLLSRDFAPLNQRLRAVIAREHEIPKMLAAARKNLRNPPKIYTEVALSQLPGIIHFFRSDVPPTFVRVTSGRLKIQFNATNRAVIASLQSYEKFLRDTLLAKSKGDFRLGPGLYRRKLQLEEGVDLPLDRLLAIGMADLRANQQRYLETAQKLDPNRRPEQILERMNRDHPTADGLLPAFRSTLGGLRQFIVDHRIVTLPSKATPIVRPTPPFARALTFASMDAPGVFERKTRTAYFYVTPAEPQWPKEKIESHLQSFTTGEIVSTAVHEAWPGHFVQFLYEDQAPTKVRKLIGCGTNSEGWAHYCEQMMLDAGYGGKNDRLRLGQLRDALLRNARFIAGIRMHTGGMTYDQAVKFFMDEGHQPRAAAEREALRGTSDPTYLVYTLGKLQILKLRQDYANMRGRDFRLGEFHDAFLRQGSVPIRVIRRSMLGNDTPSL